MPLKQCTSPEAPAASAAVTDTPTASVAVPASTDAAKPVASEAKAEAGGHEEEARGLAVITERQWFDFGAGKYNIGTLIDGQSVMWAAYLEQLRRTVEWCDEKLAGYEPFEFESQGESA